MLLALGLRIAVLRDELWGTAFVDRAPEGRCSRSGYTPGTGFWERRDSWPERLSGQLDPDQWRHLVVW